MDSVYPIKIYVTNQMDVHMINNINVQTDNVLLTQPYVTKL